MTQSKADSNNVNNKVRLNVQEKNEIGEGTNKVTNLKWRGNAKREHRGATSLDNTSQILLKLGSAISVLTRQKRICWHTERRMELKKDSGNNRAVYRLTGKVFI